MLRFTSSLAPFRVYWGGPRSIDPLETKKTAGKTLGGYTRSREATIKMLIIGRIALVVLALAGSGFAQEQLMRVKGGHQLGETAEQFFAEGYEKEAVDACAAGDFKSVNKSSKRQLKKYCGDLADERQQARSGKRIEYKGGGDLSEMRTDTFTFDGGRLVKVELLFSAPSAEVNYRGQSFDKIFAGVKEAYGPPTGESTERVQDAYGVPYLAHRELWVAPQAVVLITERPGPGGSTTLLAFTRAEYDRTMAAGAPKAANPLQ
jgi:hypothetical protein